MPTIAPLAYLNYEVQNKLKPGPLEGLSIGMLDQHWMLYKGYVTNVNLLNKTIWDCLETDKDVSEPRMAEVQRRLGFEYNGMLLHEYYFGALKKGVPQPLMTSALHAKISKDFGSFERWRKQFTEIGKMRGVGWAVTSLNPISNRLINTWIGDHETGHIVGYKPIVVMDVWEHAFVGDYGSNNEGRQKYIEAFFQNLDWNVIAERLLGSR